MVTTLGVLQYILTIVVTEAVQGLLFCEVIESGKGEYFAGTLIASRFVGECVVMAAVVKAARFVMIVSGDGVDHLIKTDLFRLAGNFTEQRLNRHDVTSR